MVIGLTIMSFHEVGMYNKVYNDDVVTINTDGSCLGNPGVGGWAAILTYKGIEREISGGCDCRTTNNRMELTAVIEGLKALKRPCTVVIRSDSEYVVAGINERVRAWQKHKWRGCNANIDLWKTILGYMDYHNAVVAMWVKSHNDDPKNERCDKLAKSEARQIKLCE